MKPAPPVTRMVSMAVRVSADERRKRCQRCIYVNDNGRRNSAPELRSGADRDGEIRRRDEVSDPLRAAPARHLERGAEPVDRHESELPRRLCVTASRDEDRAEPV